MPRQSFTPGKLCCLLQICKREQFSSQFVLQRQQSGADKVGVVRFDGMLGILQRKSSVCLMLEWLRLHTVKRCSSASFSAIAVSKLSHNIFVTTLAVTQYGAEVALGTRGHK